MREEEDQTIRVLSREAEAKRVPSLENLTEDTARVCPDKVLRCRYGLYGCCCWLPPPLAMEEYRVLHLAAVNFEHRLSIYWALKKKNINSLNIMIDFKPILLFF